MGREQEQAQGRAQDVLTTGSSAGASVRSRPRTGARREPRLESPAGVGAVCTSRRPGGSYGLLAGERAGRRQGRLLQAVFGETVFAALDGLRAVHE
ncbi:hypothetical protein J116_027650 [Streptomyces thermolilacinus SPC6]|uniref:Uncharacterized protein n=1 Tax=Streptomyces thermolilacinus SPC6 TaxID=1306406 RepID=A0A1D3DZC2_9ACTN|nr:hypothetical protein J116_027650 [Streptomyces thermolilacinus SPC6]